MQYETLREVGRNIDTVCKCMDVSFGEIMRAIEGGACSLWSLEDATLAGSVCGKCISASEDPDGEREIHLDEILELAKKEGLCFDPDEDCDF